MAKLRAYRLENAQGQGPFYGEQLDVDFLRQHTNPDLLFRVMGYPDKLLKILLRMGFVFGWRTRDSYRKFFKPGGEASARDFGYTCKIYEPDFAITLPDNQVMFLKPIQARVLEDHPVIALATFSELLEALSQKPNPKDDGLIPLTNRQARALIAARGK